MDTRYVFIIKGKVIVLNVVVHRYVNMVEEKEFVKNVWVLGYVIIKGKDMIVHYVVGSHVHIRRND